MAGWAEKLDLPGPARDRWLAAATLHDALRDVDPADFEAGGVYPAEAVLRWPPHLLHGPACAHRLLRDGVEEESVLRAVAFHTTGHPDLDEMGEYLYLADFLEPGRRFLPEVREAMRKRLPGSRPQVLLEVIGLRIRHLIDRRSGMLEETVRFWNRVVAELPA